MNKIDELLPQSKRVFEKLGMHFVGEKPCGYENSGEPVAEFEYAMAREERPNLSLQTVLSRIELSSLLAVQPYLANFIDIAPRPALVDSPSEFI